MTLFKNWFPESVEEFAEERPRKKYSGTFDDQELVEAESGSCKTIFEKDDHSELRFLRK